HYHLDLIFGYIVSYKIGVWSPSDSTRDFAHVFLNNAISIIVLVPKTVALILGLRDNFTDIEM
ncbi:hypothetical protein, partial [Aeromonas sp. ZOR0002]|uniref:hypothetical protein n=1 Tax=Aeromonas sp. ZOR0002 TaxID=1339228 RepID=UPI001E414BCD